MVNKIELIKVLNCTYGNQIPSNPVAHYLFNNNENKAIAYLDNLCNTKILRKLNSISNHNKAIYKFINDENGKLNCNICPFKCKRYING